MSLDNKGAVVPSDPQATALAACVPPFWRRNLELWFVHLEMSEITADATKFNHAILGLDEETILLVADIVKTASYNVLKTEHIKRLSVSESAKLDHLLAGLTFGDRTPSQLLREMRQLSGSKIDDDLLKSLWLRRLPESTQAVLACVSSSLEALAAAADKVHDTMADSAKKPPDARSRVNSRISQKTRSAGGLGDGHPERSATSPNNL